MNKKARKRRGSSKAGRPRKEGARYACGKLKASEPNAIVLSRRRELCDDTTMASCPLDAMRGNNWLTASEHHAGCVYVDLRRRAVPCGPGLALGSNQEAASSVLDDVPNLSARNVWDLMPDAQVAAVWDAALREVRAPADTEAADLRAMATLRRVEAAMTRLERAEVERVCIRQDWPSWFAAKRAGEPHDGAHYDVLVAGLRNIARALSPVRAANDAARKVVRIEATPYRPNMHGQPVERLVYVNENGERVLEVEKICRRGVDGVRARA